MRRDEPAARRVTLVGEVALVRNYQRALTLLGLVDRRGAGLPGRHGLWRIADKAGLSGFGSNRVGRLRRSASPRHRVRRRTGGVAGPRFHERA
jgi:hypothetical protein